MAIDIVRADYSNPAHAQGILLLLDHYASGIEGGGKPLGLDAKVRLLPAMAVRPHLFSVLAFDERKPGSP